MSGQTHVLYFQLVAKTTIIIVIGAACTSLLLVPYPIYYVFVANAVIITMLSIMLFALVENIFEMIFERLLSI